MVASGLNKEVKLQRKRRKCKPTRNCDECTIRSFIIQSISQAALRVMVENEKGKLIENSIAEMSNGSPREAGLVTLTPSGADKKKTEN